MGGFEGGALGCGGVRRVREQLDLDEREVALLNGAHERGEAVDVLLGCAGAAGFEEVLGDLEVALTAGVVKGVVPAQTAESVDSSCARAASRAMREAEQDSALLMC
jgi:hypothetical protein